MAFTPVNQLETSLVAATHNPASRADFYRAVTAADLFIISESPKPADGSFVADEKTQLKIQLVEVEGKPHVPVFSSKERISAIVKAEVPFIAMNGRAAFTMLRAADVVMNPGSEYGKIFKPEEIESILNGRIFETIAPPNVVGQKVMLAQPSEFPNHVVEPIRQFFATMEHITRAYLARAVFQQSPEQPHIFIGIETTGNWEELLKQASPIVQPVVRSGEIVDLIRMSQRPDDGVSTYFRSTPPIYERTA
jgi:hypothetical protein